MNELAIRIEELLFEGETPSAIAKELNISLAQVEETIAELECMDIEPVDFYDDADADADALASAGFGTDEDYSYDSY